MCDACSDVRHPPVTLGSSVLTPKAAADWRDFAEDDDKSTTLPSPLGARHPGQLTGIGVQVQRDVV